MKWNSQFQLLFAHHPQTPCSPCHATWLASVYIAPLLPTLRRPGLSGIHLNLSSLRSASCLSKVTHTCSLLTCLCSSVSTVLSVSDWSLSFAANIPMLFVSPLALPLLTTLRCPGLPGMHPQPILSLLSVLSFQVYARLLSSHLPLLLGLHCAFHLQLVSLLLQNTPLLFVPQESLLALPLLL